MKVLEGSRAHMAHLQFHAYGGDDWDTMRSEAAHDRRVLQRAPEPHRPTPAPSCSANAVTITADGPWQHLLYQLTGRKWGNLDVENETGCGIVPYVYKEKQPGQRRAVGGRAGTAAAHQRPVAGLPDDRPSQRGGFWRYPEIIQLLMDADFRREQREEAAAEGAEADRPGRTWTASTRSPRSPSSRRPGPARALGLAQKGHLGVGRGRRRGDLQRETRTAWRMFVTRATSSRAARSWSRRARSGRSVEGREFVVQPGLRPRRSRTSCARCSSSTTRCRSTTTRSRRSASTACSSPSAGSAPDADGACLRLAGPSS